MNRVCLISNYDSGVSWTVYVEGLFICKRNRGHADYSFWYSIINGSCCFNLDERIEIYNKYDIDTIIVCEDGDINIYTIDEDYALHEKYNF